MILSNKKNNKLVDSHTFILLNKKMKHVSDGERIAIASLNRKETELLAVKRERDNYMAQLRAMSKYISELKESNQILSSQVRYLVSKQK